tara:strand:+ start:30 stop:374 length:345 start_codon:yes stop_codon:yes gene_type:complete
MDKIYLYTFFFLGCMSARFGLAYAAKIIDIKYLPYMALLTSVISITFFINFMKHKTGDRGGFGNKVWWNYYRLVHSFLFGLFSILAFNKYDNSWILLFIDAMLGLYFFINKYFL